MPPELAVNAGTLQSNSGGVSINSTQATVLTPGSSMEGTTVQALSQGTADFMKGATLQGACMELSAAHVRDNGSVQGGSFLLDPTNLKLVDSGAGACYITVATVENNAAHTCKVTLCGTTSVKLANNTALCLKSGNCGAGAGITVTAGAGGISATGTGGIATQGSGAISLSSTGAVTLTGYGLQAVNGKVSVSGTNVTTGAITTSGTGAICVQASGTLNSGALSATGGGCINLLSKGKLTTCGTIQALKNICVKTTCSSLLSIKQNVTSCSGNITLTNNSSSASPAIRIGCFCFSAVNCVTLSAVSGTVTLQAPHGVVLAGGTLKGACVVVKGCGSLVCNFVQNVCSTNSFLFSTNNGGAVEALGTINGHSGSVTMKGLSICLSNPVDRRIGPTVSGRCITLNASDGVCIAEGASVTASGKLCITASGELVCSRGTLSGKCVHIAAPCVNMRGSVHATCTLCMTAGQLRLFRCRHALRQERDPLLRRPPQSIGLRYRRGSGLHHRVRHTQYREHAGDQNGCVTLQSKGTLTTCGTIQAVKNICLKTTCSCLLSIKQNVTSCSGNITITNSSSSALPRISIGCVTLSAVNGT